jgi:hypothetical protein
MKFHVEVHFAKNTRIIEFERSNVPGRQASVTVALERKARTSRQEPKTQRHTKDALVINRLTSFQAICAIYFSILAFVTALLVVADAFRAPTWGRLKEACRHPDRSTVLCLPRPHRVAASLYGSDRDRVDAECCAWPSPLPRPAFRAPCSSYSLRLCQ